MFNDISDRLRISLNGVPAIGDSLRDIQAARAAGAAPMLVRTGKGADTATSPELGENVPVYNDLYSAVDSLLND
jgi:D-glycero-D-manno-heptose 1,7-bisphosphate phosphatase